MIETSDILLVEACGNVGFQVLRSLVSHGLKVSVCCPSEDEPAMRCGLAGGTYVTLPHKDEANYIRQLKDISVSCGASMIMPVFHPETVASHRGEFSPVTVTSDDPDKVELLDNKLSLHLLAESLGINVPHRFRSPDEVTCFPVVFRRVKGQGGDSVYFPKDRRALDNLIRSSAPSSYMITEYIEGRDISVDAVRWDGFYSSGAYRTILPERKGISVLRESIICDEAYAMLRKILDNTGYRGVCGADFRLSADNELFLLECNPRFSGGLLSQVISGFDMPWLLYLLAAGQSPEMPVFTPGLLSGSRAGVDALCAKGGEEMRNTVLGIVAGRTVSYDDQMLLG